MQFGKSLASAFQVITAGLALAFVAVILKPELLDVVRPPTQPTPPATPAIAIPGGSAPTSYADAVARSAPAVVNISTAKLVTERPNPLFEDPVFRRFFGEAPDDLPRQRLETSLGSGVIVSDSGHVLTNNHVIAGADQIVIQLADGRVAEATLVGADPESDLAVLETELHDPPQIALGSSETLRVGDIVLAIGNSFGVGQTVTMGIVSATGRNDLRAVLYEDFIQTDAAINAGNSGGALVNAAGEVIGINTRKLGRAEGGQNIGFAIPIAQASDVMEQIIEYGTVRRGWLGAQFSDLPLALQADGSSIRQGIQVRDVTVSGPAWNAGIRAGDILLAIDGTEYDDARAVLLAIAQLAPGTQVELEVQRNAQPFSTYATLIQQPPLR